MRRLLEAPVLLPADDGPALSVSLSVGVAHRRPDDDMGVEQLMEQADQAMYQDKHRLGTGP